MKKTFSKYLLAGGLFVCSTVNNLQAQITQPCATVNSIVINTGYNPTSGTAISTGASDPKWIITYLSPALTSLTSLTVGSAPIAVTTHALWQPNSSSSRYLGIANSANSGGINTSGTGGPYETKIKRFFKTCVEDSITIDMDFAGDDTIKSITVDTYPTIYTNPGAWNGGSYTHRTVTYLLSPGSHWIEYTLANLVRTYTHNDNYYGIDIEGTVFSATGNNSVVSNLAPVDCQCQKTDTCAIKGLSICTDPFGSPFDYTFSPFVTPSGSNIMLDFGDGSTYTGTSSITLTHTYAPGSYIVTLYVLDNGGRICSERHFEMCISGDGAKSQPTKYGRQSEGYLPEPYPNPSKSTINVPVYSSKDEIIISIVGQEGKVIQTKKISSREDNAIIELSTTRLSPGIYFINIVDGQGKRVKQFTKL